MFGALCAGRPVQTNLQILSDTQVVFHLPSPRTINHLVVFLLPDTVLPPTHGATVHIRFPNRQFQLLGAISAAKPSAVFRVRGLAGFEDGDAMTDAAMSAEVEEVILGISVEPAAAVEQQLATLHQNDGSTANSSTALVRHRPPLSTVDMARRIIQNAFNFLSSFAVPDPAMGGQDMIPLKAFQEWWGKFEKKIEYDPSFLEREDSA